MGETIQCTSGKFVCLTPHDKYECLTKNFMCDGHVDCKENYDERHCNKCSETLWSCHDHSADGKLECISKDWVCDGTTDCNDGSDERVCNNNSRPAITDNVTDVAVAKRRIKEVEVEVTQTTQHSRERHTKTERYQTTDVVSHIDETASTQKATRQKTSTFAKYILRLPVTTGPLLTIGQVSQKSHEGIDDFKTILSSTHGLILVTVVAVLVLVLLIAGTVIIARCRKSTKQSEHNTKAIDTRREDSRQCYAPMNNLVDGDRVENNVYEDIEDLSREMLPRLGNEEPQDANFAEFNKNYVTNHYQAIHKMPTKPYSEYSSLNEQLEDGGALDTLVLYAPKTSEKRNSAYAAVSTLPRNDVLPYETPITVRSTLNNRANNTDIVNKQNSEEHFGNTSRGNLQSGEYDSCTFENSQFGPGENSPNDYLNPIYSCTSQTRHETPNNDYLHPMNSK